MTHLKNTVLVFCFILLNSFFAYGQKKVAPTPVLAPSITYPYLEANIIIESDSVKLEIVMHGNDFPMEDIRSIDFDTNLSNWSFNINPPDTIEQWTTEEVEEIDTIFYTCSSDLQVMIERTETYSSENSRHTGVVLPDGYCPSPSPSPNSSFMPEVMVMPISGIDGLCYNANLSNIEMTHEDTNGNLITTSLSSVEETACSSNTYMVTQKTATPTNRFQVFPNPTSDYFHLALDYPIESNALLRVWNLQGTLMYQQSLSPFDTSLTLSTIDWQLGMYILQIDTQEGVFQKKISVVK